MQCFPDKRKQQSTFQMIVEKEVKQTKNKFLFYKKKIFSWIRVFVLILSVYLLFIEVNRPCQMHLNTSLLLNLIWKSSWILILQVILKIVVSKMRLIAIQMTSKWLYKLFGKIGRFKTCSFLILSNLLSLKVLMPALNINYLNINFSHERRNQH